MSRSLSSVAAAVAALAVTLSACGSGNKNQEESESPPTTKKQDTAEVTTEPEPITAAEEHWLVQIKRYSDRLEDEFARPGTITHATMRRRARLYLNCEQMLERAGDPGRFEPAGQFAERGCERLKNAAKFLEQAIAATERGGYVVVGTPEEKQFDRAFAGASEASGNGLYELQRAVGRAEEIEWSFGS